MSYFKPFNFFIFLLFLSLNQIARGQKLVTNWDSLYNAKSKEAIGTSFPLFKIKSDEAQLTNEDFKGKVVFINFWFDLCPPCTAEIEALNELYEKLKDNKNFKFISFTFESPSKVREIKNKYNIMYNVFSIKQEECYRLNQNGGFPTSIILDPNGTIKYFVSGGASQKETARAFVMNVIYLKLLQELKV